MRFFSKNTHTLIGSIISSIRFYVLSIFYNTQIKGKGQVVNQILKFTLSFFILIFTFYTFPAPVHAIYDPLSVPNNKFGIHLIQATPDESSPAAELVNTNGDWGYVTVLIESKDRKEDKWNEFFNDLRRRHLIPIVRLATEPEGNNWKRPYEGEEIAWADFLDNLNWPTKNRYIIIYNEPNHSTEWGGVVDAKSYAQVLDKTITALKNKNSDFFVLNAGFDASAPQEPPKYGDQVTFMQQMENSVPGIFNKLDGWVSHSYPNPGFAGSPNASGRGTVRTYIWEMQLLKSFGIKKDLPVFIAETGWKHAEGINHDPFLPSSETVSNYYKNAFESAWNSNEQSSSASRIVAITPFLLSYQEPPFDHFSFKRLDSEKLPQLGVIGPSYYPQYDVLKNMPKVLGKPIQENRAKLIKGEVYSSIVSGETYDISITFKNIGQSIWNGSTSLTTSDQVKLVALEGGKELGIETVEIPKEVKVEPGGEYTFALSLKAPQKGVFKVALNLYSGSKEFDSSALEFETEVKSPVILKISSLLKWKEIHSGDYFLSIEGPTGDTVQKVTLSEAGQSGELEARYLLPDYAFEFTLEKTFYKPKTIRQTVKAGLNSLDFGVLEPDIRSVLLNPKELWKLLPFSN